MPYAPDIFAYPKGALQPPFEILLFSRVVTRLALRAFFPYIKVSRSEVQVVVVVSSSSTGTNLLLLLRLVVVVVVVVAMQCNSRGWSTG